MRPLKDAGDELDPRMARLSEIVRRSRPLARSEARKARVAAALTSPKRLARPMKLRPVAIGVVLFGAVASAMIARAWTRRTHEAPAPNVSRPQTTLTQPTPPAAVVAEPAVAEPAPASREPNLAAVPKPRTAGASRSVTSSRLDDDDLAALARGMGTAPAERDVSRAPIAEVPPAPASPSHEAALLATAVQALRGDHDPKRAQSLLEDYLKRYPRGMLAEEALAMAVEAAAAHGDRKTSSLAETYLRRYPGGRFRGVAESAVQRFGH